MLDARNLKTKIKITKAHVECPVLNCQEMVARQRRTFKKEPVFQCPAHKIYISPSTFEYPDEKDNLLWSDKNDMNLLASIRKFKRESRMARDNSEDALTWNVFRYLHKEGYLESFLAFVSNLRVSDSELIYWSYSQVANGTWPLLTDARIQFGEQPNRSSEPDLIAVTPEALFFIENKLTANNATVPSSQANQKAYTSGENEWYRRVFNSDFETVAITSKMYELLRFWLLGTWIADKMNCDFFLVNVVRESKERQIVNLFSSHIVLGPSRHFLRLTWEEIYYYIANNPLATLSKKQIISYFETHLSKIA